MSMTAPNYTSWTHNRTPSNKSSSFSAMDFCPVVYSNYNRGTSSFMLGTFRDWWQISCWTNTPDLLKTLQHGHTCYRSEYELRPIKGFAGDAHHRLAVTHVDAAGLWRCAVPQTMKVDPPPEGSSLSPR